MSVSTSCFLRRGLGVHALPYIESTVDLSGLLGKSSNIIIKSDYSMAPLLSVFFLVAGVVFCGLDYLNEKKL